MNDLSIFVDESGDFGPYESHAPYYIVTLVFHEQRISVADEIAHFDQSLREIGMENHVVHAGPLIRREEVYCILRRRADTGAFANGHSAAAADST